MNPSAYRRHGYGEFVIPVSLLIVSIILLAFAEGVARTVTWVVVLLLLAFMVCLVLFRPEYRLESDRMVIVSRFRRKEILYRNITKCELYQDLKVRWWMFRYAAQGDIYHASDHRIRIHYTEGDSPKTLVIRAERANVFCEELRSKTGTGLCIRKHP